ncbi:hypothetical protein DCS_04543 [Drechmeria coniospora]|uniref:Uncharacterized protein n=1 Tax=Drechmeria coniospora TaxID=98403 RepID=A0A151GKJ5_DRECN|nr:hypothetical protein DCS_04543 [Drechmeria coniospora]KYK57532.1 hypothetical protein DCS_04543 [Drechmeria coniospora]ODA79419.1 hypothetical protein RJ55_05012 [Drechmeria coniospora]
MAFLLGLAGLALRSTRHHDGYGQGYGYGQPSMHQTRADYYCHLPVSAVNQQARADYYYRAPVSTVNHQTAAGGNNISTGYYAPRQRRGCCGRKAQRRYERELRREARSARRVERKGYPSQVAPAPAMRNDGARPTAPGRDVFVTEVRRETRTMGEAPPTYEELERSGRI